MSTYAQDPGLKKTNPGLVAAPSCLNPPPAASPSSLKKVTGQGKGIMPDKNPSACPDCPCVACFPPCFLMAHKLPTG